MLSQLYLRNFAVIKEAAIDFHDGFNVFTGETGAGKTILVSAVSGVLGARLSKEIIRTGEDSAYISALFTDISPKVCGIISELGYEAEDNSLIITRELKHDSKNICKIGGRPATLQILKEVASHLIDIHGQRDSGQLLNPATHLQLLDDYGQLYEYKKNYRSFYDKAVAIEKKIKSLGVDENQKQKRIAELSYIIEEIDKAELVVGEEETLNSRKIKITNIQRIAMLLENARLLLDGDDERDAGAIRLMEGLRDTLLQLGAFLPEMNELSDKVEAMSIELDDMRMNVGSKLDGMEYEPNELDIIEERLELIHRLKRKYGGDVEDILKLRDKSKAELADIKQSDSKLKELHDQLDSMMDDLMQAADELTAARIKAGESFVAAVQAELSFLNMPSVKLFVDRKETESLKSSGQDEVEFLISTNIGEPAKPMAKIASGGELSRIMLSIKNVFADKDLIATSIFDEIDTGVSGKAAQKIGMKMKQVAKNRQVIAVTHLAQVAAFASHHLCIQKQVENDRTFTTVTPLSEIAREHEIARIISGENITELSLQNAKEMLELAKS
ncbi:MAG: DNA repair protein RecN [Oscillospiraceae bacterium]|nr:DNA repair protein RecN [Oscillospiraceae bacterium]